MTLSDALALGRVSNLPTVWTNVLAGVVLSGAGLTHPALLPLMIALTLFYVGGMYLNDFFDAEIDARERPERPIPAGRTARRTVGMFGFGMLAVAVVVMVYIAAGQIGTPWPALSGIALAACIVLYDTHHKANPLSPFIMGLCRILIYLCAAFSVLTLPPYPVVAAAAALLCYLIGLTYVAKQENLGRVANMWPLCFLAAPVLYGANLARDEAVTWLFVGLLVAWILVALRFVLRRQPGDIPRGVVSLIAGICLVDAMLVASVGATDIAVLCVAGFIATLFLQRHVAGT